MSDALTPSVVRLLSDAAWRVDAAAAHALAAGAGMRSPSADATLVYAVSGAVDARADAPGSPGADLVAGDLLLVLGGAARVRAHHGGRASVVVATVATVRGARALAGLPTTIAVPGFATREPAIAHLAAALGCHDDARAPTTTSDGVICAHMATTILAAALRAWMLCDAAAGDWGARAGDPSLAPALDAIHADLARAWTVEELALLGSMSRSGFAARFRAAMGVPPLRYLTRVRIAAAKRHLADDGLGVAQTAGLLGYASEDGFSRAFRRATGLAPSAWRTRATADALPVDASVVAAPGVAA